MLFDMDVRQAEHTITQIYINGLGYMEMNKYNSNKKII